MAKNGSSTIGTILTVLGVGAGAFVIYKLVSPSAPVKVPATVPASNQAAAPGNFLTTLSTIPISRGALYSYWASQIQQVNQDFLSGKISFQASQAKFHDMRLAINQDYVNNKLTSDDLDDLNSNISTYGG